MSFDLHKEFATDEKSELEGIWEEVSEGAKVLIARVGNDRYTERYKKLGKGIQRQIDRGTLPSEKVQKIFISILADTILLNWEGFANKGEPLPYNRENCMEMLKDYPDFRQMVWDMANDAETFRLDNRDEDLGNSLKPSDTASDTVETK